MAAASDDQVARLRQAMQVLVRRFGALAGDQTPCGQPLAIGHAHALMVLRARGPLSQQALGRELGIDKSNVARLCARMTTAGHVVQAASPTDRRSRVVDLTERGRRLAAQVDGSSRARFRALLAGIRPAHRAQVLAGLDHLAVAASSLRRSRPRSSRP